jgi:5,6,7,8-tetrahydromethanopterin hydro-lyase
MTDIWFRTGEATVLAAEGQVTDAMPEVVIGSVRGPVGQAFASMMGQVKGHTRMFVVRDLNQAVRPATMMTTKVTIKNMAYAELLGGVVQAAMGDAIVDCLIEDILPKDQADELCMIITVWLDPRCA